METALKDALSDYDCAKLKHVIDSFPREELKKGFDIAELAWDMDTPPSFLRLLTDTFPELLLEPTVSCSGGNLPLHHALHECAPVANIMVLIEANPKSLWIKGEDDCLPIHNAYIHWTSFNRDLSKLEKLKEKQEIIRTMLKRYPESTLVESELMGSMLELVSRKTVQEPLFTCGNIDQDEAETSLGSEDEDINALDWEIRMEILRVAHDAWRKKKERPTSPVFHPICAAIELLADSNFDMIFRVAFDSSFKSSNAMEDLVNSMFGHYWPHFHIMEKIDVLKLLIYCDDNDRYWDLIKQYRVEYQNFRFAFRMGRYYMIEETIKRYPEHVNTPNDNGILPLELAKALLDNKNVHFLQTELGYSILFTLIHSSGNDFFLSTPASHILELLKLNSRIMSTIPSQVLVAGKEPFGHLIVDGTCCSICLLPYQENNTVSWSNTACKHVFHRDCILEWFSTKKETNCPCCRQPFLGPSDTKIDE